MADTTGEHHLFKVHLPGLELNDEQRAALAGVSSDITYYADGNTTVVRGVEAHDEKHARWRVTDPLGLGDDDAVAYRQ